jgi:hypothetical protein
VHADERAVVCDLDDHGAQLASERHSWRAAPPRRSDWAEIDLCLVTRRAWAPVHIRALPLRRRLGR